MAPLTEDAAVIRARSRALRKRGDLLRVVTRRRMETTRDRLQESHELYAVLEARRARGIPSPWSDLRWSAPGTELDGVLEAV